MERYHIFKLGLAIVFYAAYCARPMLVYSLEADNQIQGQPRSQPLGDYYRYYQGLDGQPGVDFPIYSYIPRTTFSCRGVESGYYADLETNCQVFHICEANKKISFLCPNGTIFQQSELICEWWNKVNCSNSPSFYESSAERLQNDVAKRKLSRRVNLSGGDFNHGAVMRMEERSSVSATKNGKNYPVQQEAHRRRNQNHRIPENNDIDLNIASEESNNRHLARANTIQQNNKHPNHRYEENKEKVHIRKDINRDTGNFINGINQENANNYIRGRTNIPQNHRNTDQDYQTTQNPNNFNGKTSTTTMKNNYRGQTTYQTSSYSNSVTPNYNNQNNKMYEINSQQNSNKKEFGVNRSQNNKDASSFVAQNNNQKYNNEYQKNQNNRQPIKNNYQQTQYYQNLQTTEAQGLQNYQNQNQFNRHTQTTPRPAGLNTAHEENFGKTNAVALNNSKEYNNIYQNTGQLNQNTYQQTQYNENGQILNTQSLPNYQNNFTYHTEPTPRSSSFNPTTQVFGQRTTFGQNTQIHTTQSLRYTAQSNNELQKTQNYDSTTLENQFDVTTKPISQRYTMDTRQQRYKSDGTTRPIPKTSENGVQNVPMHMGNTIASEKKNQRISTTQAPIQTSSQNLNNNEYNDISQVPVYIGNVFAPEKQRQTVFVPPRQAEIITVPPQQAEGISIAPQEAKSLFTPSRFAQSLSLPSQSILSNSSPVQNVQSYSTSSQNFQPTTTTTARPANNVQGRNINYRGNTKFNADNFDDGQPKKYKENNFDDKTQAKHVIDQKAPKRKIENSENHELEFPKHKSELKRMSNNDLDESQITQESASFVRSPFNSINDNYKTSVSPYPNHRSTYSDIKPQVSYEVPKMTSISSITPHLVTTQPINNGKPFVGSKVGSTLVPNKSTSTNGATYLPTSSTTSLPTTHEIIFGVLRHSSTTVNPYGPPKIFNLGEREKTLPPLETQTKVTNSVPTELFNLGKTDNTLQPNVIPTYFTTTVEPLDIYVPDEGSLNLETNKQSTDAPKEIFEPPFIKKLQPLLYSSSQSIQTTPKTFDHAFESSTSKNKYFISSTTEIPDNDAEVILTHNNNNLNDGVSIRFDKGQEKVAVHLSKSLGDQNINKQIPVIQSSNDYLRSSAGQSLNSSVLPYKNELLVTKAPNYNLPFQSTVAPPKSQTQKPRPFSKSLDLNTKNQNDQIPTYATYPAYSLSSARPFQKPETTKSTLTTKNFAYENVDNMLNVLKEIAGANNKNAGSDRSGLVIPPSVGPQTLHSLAQYFANELNTEQEVLDSDTKEEFTGLLTQMTVHGYNTLFRNEPKIQEKELETLTKNLFSTSFVTTTTTDNPTYSTVISNELPSTTIATPPRHDSASDDNQLTNEVDPELTDLGSTLEPPLELRQLARNFSLALSSYLNDPEKFRKQLEILRPTEPPSLEGEENEISEAESGDEELLNFSDADLKSSTPFFYPSSPSPPSPTWGYILANAPKGSNEVDSTNPLNNRDNNFAQNTAKSVLRNEVKNGLTPDLNTADSQSLNPSYNNNFILNDEKKNNNTGFPPNHNWTSSPEVTNLWQKTLSVDPLSVNDNLVTTSLPITSSETTETYAEDFYSYDDSLVKIDEPSAEISYKLKTLQPPLNMNSTQIHGILLDFMNHTKDSEQNRLQRILKKLNTSEDEFLSRMREIESNPLTKRLILLLISECGANITHSLTPNEQNQEDVEILNTDHSSASVPSTNIGGSIVPRSANLEESVNSSLINLVDPNLKADDEDARALQLLNALYSIASRFGKK